MTEVNRSDASATEYSSTSDPVSLDLTSAQFSWIRSDLSNLRTMLSWLRTSVSMIGFGFTICNFYSGFFEDIATPRIESAARNLGLAPGSVVADSVAAAGA